MRILLLVAVLGLAAAGCHRRSPPVEPAAPEEPPPSAPAPVLNVDSMREAFRRNEAAAKQDYVGKRFRIRLRVERIGEEGELYGRVAVPGNPFDADDAAVFMRPGEAEAVKRGQAVWVEADFREYTPGVVLPLWMSGGKLVK